MSSFAVRHAETQEVVGIFAASSLEGLRNVVDECTDPWICEYVRLSTNGGIFVPDRTEAQWPARFKNEDELFDEDENALNESVLSESWLDNIMFGRWKPLGAKE